jgi:hypothetical protein
LFSPLFFGRILRKQIELQYQILSRKKKGMKSKHRETKKRDRIYVILLTGEVHGSTGGSSHEGQGL